MVYKKKNQWHILNLENWKNNKNDFLIKVKNFNNRSISNELINHYINVNENNFSKLQLEEYYWKDIINCTVVNEKSENLGVVKKIIDTGSNNVLIIHSYCNKKDILIPFINKYVIKNVDLNKKIIIVKWNVF